MRLRYQTKEILSLILSIGIGALAGVGTLGFLVLIKVGQWGLWPGQGEFMARVMAAPWWLKLLIPTLGGLAVGPLIAFWAPEARGPGVPDVIEAAALREGHMSPRSALLKAGCTALTIASGGSVGREGPVVGLGAAIGSAMTRLFSFSEGKGRICLACGVAAGFAATFNTPIAGALFTIEVILADMEVVYLGHIVIAAIVGVLISRQFFGDFPTFAVAPFVFHQNVELLVYLALGLLAGLIAIAFTVGIYATDSWFRGLTLPEWLKPALGGLGLGALALVSPYVLGVGYDSINLGLAGKFALSAAALLLLMKYLATVLCLGSGMSGGIMGPFVPAMVSCIASFMVVKSLYGYSTYETKLLRRGVKIFLGRGVHVLQSMHVKDYLSREMEILHDDTPLPEILQRAEASPYPNFVVLDDHDELSGVLTLWDLRKVQWPREEAAKLLTARDLKTPDAVTVHPDDDFETALKLLQHKNFSFLPVVLPPRDRVVVGILKIDDVLTAYNQRLLKDRVLRYPPRGS
ncbi:MAG: chloride channel protein [Syntrophobacterales bacterium]|jgi:CIC family chloride channel protein|nr:chloride channel protein [Syntrophobacterales bacterium]